MARKARCECLTLELQHSNLANMRIYHLLLEHQAVSAAWTLLNSLLT